MAGVGGIIPAAADWSKNDQRQILMAKSATFIGRKSPNLYYSTMGDIMTRNVSGVVGGAIIQRL